SHNGGLVECAPRTPALLYAVVWALYGRLGAVWVGALAGDDDPGAAPARDRWGGADPTVTGDHARNFSGGRTGNGHGALQHGRDRRPDRGPRPRGLVNGYL